MSERRGPVGVVPFPSHANLSRGKVAKIVDRADDRGIEIENQQWPIEIGDQIGPEKADFLHPAALWCLRQSYFHLFLKRLSGKRQYLGLPVDTGRIIRHAEEAKITSGVAFQSRVEAVHILCTIESPVLQTYAIGWCHSNVRLLVVPAYRITRCQSNSSRTTIRCRFTGRHPHLSSVDGSRTIGPRSLARSPLLHRCSVASCLQEPRAESARQHECESSLRRCTSAQKSGS